MNVEPTEPEIGGESMMQSSDNRSQKLRNYLHQLRVFLRLAEEGIEWNEVPILNDDLDVAGKQNVQQLRR